MADQQRQGLFIDKDGHRCWLKWHRGRKQKGDIAFTPARILEGMRLGASVEIDLVCHAGNGFAVLHDRDLHPATTGQGLVASASPDILRGLFLRENPECFQEKWEPVSRPETRINTQATSSPHRVMLLEDLAALLAGESCPETALLQLDLKEEAAALNEAIIENFAAAVAPVAGRMILSGGDAEAVRRLAEATPGLAVGYDPCHFGAAERLLQERNFHDFVRSAVTALPGIRMIYLEYELILAADQLGYNLVAAFQSHGVRIDAYTIRKADPALRPSIARLLALGVDQITTDDPVGLQALLAG
ncbi:glycerophosphodiester phosphodiesterase [Rhizobium paknamense]|uniref:Glycerophosphoryl diester phosphodiesterase n=1 Tax=Rhizobium paknamense TaxID=1206817 RepID=A0ABU0IB48_9HYPH|nr:glycerophosphodiester phosphodiesterase family protein [Rhizobium paknamense]MDQ0455447.1 glycerophosphoryl diester phosphodiesterase [Rhizobium paknamense]